MIQPAWTVLILSAEPPFVWPRVFSWADAEAQATRLTRLGFGHCVAVPVGRIEQSVRAQVSL